VAEFGRFRDCLSERDRVEDDLVETGEGSEKVSWSNQVLSL